ncbi:MAG: maltose ABC transporter substrate-binding protein [Christensenella sp.]
MKKKLAVLLAATMALSISACSQKPPSSSPIPPVSTPASFSENTPEISGDLLVWLPYENHAKAFVEAFNQKYPNVNVEYEIIGALETAEKLSLDGPAGIGADVIWTGSDRFNIEDGYIEPFPSDAQARIKDVMLESVFETKMKDGKLYGLPISMQNVALFYNKDLVSKAPETFEEIFEFAKTYNDPAKGKYAFRIAPNNSYANYFCLTPFGFRWFGNSGEDWKNPGFDSAEAAKGLAFFKSLREIFDVNNADATNDYVSGGFARGEVPFYIDGPWAIAAAQDGKVNFGIAKIPTIEGKQPYVFAGSQMIAVSSYSKNFDAAFAFAEFFMSSEGAKILYETTGTATTLKDISSIPGLSDDEYLRGFAEQATFTVPQPIIPEMSFSWEPTIKMMELVWDGGLSIKDAQAKCMEEYELLLNANGQSMYK